MLVWKPYEMIVNLITFFIWLCDVMNRRGIDGKGILVREKNGYESQKNTLLEVGNTCL
jgi:hypothetical protein